MKVLWSSTDQRQHYEWTSVQNTIQLQQSRIQLVGGLLIVCSTGIISTRLRRDVRRVRWDRRKKGDVSPRRGNGVVDLRRSPSPDEAMTICASIAGFDTLQSYSRIASANIEIGWQKWQISQLKLHERPYGWAVPPPWKYWHVLFTRFSHSLNLRVSLCRGKPWTDFREIWQGGPKK